MRRVFSLALALIVICRLVGQTNQTLSTFDATSLRRSAPNAGDEDPSINEDGSQVHYHNVPLMVLVMRGYEVHARQIVGPGWLSTDHYDVAAKVPDGAKKELIPMFFRSLLAERFKFTAHKETRNVRGFALIAGKSGPKMNPAHGEDSMQRSVGPQGARIKGKGTMARLAEALSDSLDAVVADMTGLSGMFEVDLSWAREEGASTALRELGLRLEPRTIVEDFVVIDHVERVPSEN